MRTQSLARVAVAAALAAASVGVGVTRDITNDEAPRVQAQVEAGSTLKVNVINAVGGKTVLGQLTMDQAAGPGFFTAYGCADGPPRDASGNINKSDLNFVTPAPVSNRLIVSADNNGDICIFTLVDAHIIVDVFAVTDAISTFNNQRTDTRPGRRTAAGSTLRVQVPNAVGGKTVLGQLTMDQAAGP
ncbi:MAG: hypothetical protein AAFP84_18820, partial [Actinomycetota bacterium]